MGTFVKITPPAPSARAVVHYLQTRNQRKLHVMENMLLRDNIWLIKEKDVLSPEEI
jgi:hypothetical protein